MVYAAIVAGGTGTRMGTDIPKQFLEIAGKPVLVHTISCFANKVDKIIIACHKDYIDRTKKLVADFPAEVIPGGDSRMESVQAVVKYLLSGGGLCDDIILTHDGVRPFVTEKMIDESIENARKGHFSTIAVSATDTVCVSCDGSLIDSVPDRKRIFNIQTPQTFTLGKLEQMIESCPDLEKYTDLCGLALDMGNSVKIIEGSPENMKITVQADLKTAETILERNGRL